MKIKCIGKYVNAPAGLVFNPGEEFDATDDLASFLMSDAPGCFQEVKKRGRPRKNKAILEPVHDKSKSEHRGK
jgi:hypothetical protein